jgi:nitrogen PTS system EIIA component
MEIADLLSPDAVISHLKAAGKKQVLQEMAHKAAGLTRLPERRIFETLSEREKLGSTGMGQGIAIPHGRVPGIEKMTGLFAQLDQPVDFDAMDDQPVDLVFLLLAPEGAGADHLKALARVSRLLRNQSVCEKLRAASQAAALYALLTEPSATSSQAA